MIITKKVNAVILALIIAFSMCVPAFAVDYPYVCEYCDGAFQTTDALKEHKTTCAKNPYVTTAANENNGSGYHANYYTCPGCGKQYTDMERYNECLDSHNYGVDFHWDDYINMTLPELLDWALNWFNNLIAVFTGADNDDTIGIGAGLTEIIAAITQNIVAMIAGVSSGSEADVAGAVDNLDASIAGVDFGSFGLNGINDIISAIKQKIKDFYAGNAFQVEVTEAEAPAETGSANAGIAVFAAISVAAAAAFVCTKKKA